MAESRVINTKKNILGGMLNRIVMLLLPFLTRTAIIYTFGAEYLGLNSLFAAILNVLALAELGVGSAMVFSMYKPMAEGDDDTVCALLNLYRKIYRIIGSVILIVGLSLLPFLDKLIKGNPPDAVNIYILYLIFLSNTVISYFLFAYKTSILTAAQHSYILSNISSVLSVISELTKLLMIVVFKDFYLYCLVGIPFTVINNLVANHVVNKNYPQYKCFGVLDKEIITDIKKRVAGLFMYKICYVFRDTFGSLVVSAFIGLAVLGEYNNYMYIYTSIAGFLNIIRGSMQASVGNSMVTESEDKNHSDFRQFHWIYMFMATWCTVCMFVLFQPFIKVWIGGEYQLDFLTMTSICILFLVGNNGDMCMTYRQAAGLWWQDKFRPLVESVVNVILCLVLVKPMGVLGVVLSSTICMFFINSVWAAWTLYRYYFKTFKLLNYLKRWLFYFVAGLVVMAITALVCQLVSLDGVPRLIFNGAVCIVISPLLIFAIYRLMPESRSAIAFFRKAIKLGFKAK